jgi:N-acetylmuramoyl-L-alanine amidase
MQVMEDMMVVYNGHVENIALAVVLKVGKLLEANLSGCIYTKRQIFVDLVERANLNRANAHISFHSL